jgi:iron complex outermembrane recepter protein
MRSNIVIMSLISFILFTVSIQAQDDFSDSSDNSSSVMNLSGTVFDSETGKPIAGANIIVEDSDLGAAADEEGKYTIEGAESGVSITASAIGYEDLTLFADSASLDFSLNEKVLELGALDVIAPKAKFRETPVAFSDVSKEELELRLGSRDLSMIFNEVPGAYASMLGGGAGDSRVSIRGFDQRNMAIMINGVPVNDMENGWVYWSNWDGMADVTSDVQVQRGLGASNLAVASVGGTINVRSSAADMNKGYGFKQEIGNDSFFKSTFRASTGLMDNGFAVSALFQRKTGMGYVDGTWTDAYSYFVTASKTFGDHAFDVTLLGAPQQHGQRDGDNIHNESEWNDFSDYSTNYGSEDYRQINTGGSGSGWGYVSKENAESIKMGTDESIDGFSDALFDGIQHTKEVDGKWIINNRTNYYHKPVYNLNHFWKIDDKMSLSSTMYGSNGRGGGTGPLNSRGDFLGNENYGTDGEVSYFKYINPPKDANGLYEWDKLIAWNSSDWDGNASAAIGDSDYIADEYRSKAIIRASVNHHDWYGLISTFKYDQIIPNLNLTAGVDARSYKGEHYREVVNLLGGDYYVDFSDNNDVTNADKVKRVGDKVAYHNIGYNSWFGGFVQGEYSMDKLTAVLSAAGSNTSYQREDFFNYTDDSGNQKSEKADYPGYALKVGANYNVNDKINVFGNAGMLSIAPNFRSAYLNYNNTVNPNAKNEDISSVEFGFGYVNPSLNIFGQNLAYKLNINAYNTYWQNKQLVKTANDLIYNIEGVNAVHSGVEIESRVGMFDGNLDIYSILSIGNWEWENDVVASVVSDDDRSGPSYDVEIYAGGLPVGDAPQFQFVGGLKYKTPFGLVVNPVFQFFDKHYASYDPADMDTDMGDDFLYQIEAYNTFDLHLSYNTGDLLPVPLNVGLHILNITDTEYFADYRQGSGGFYGSGTTYNLSVGLSF